MSSKVRPKLVDESMFGSDDYLFFFFVLETFLFIVFVGG